MPLVSVAEAAGQLGVSPRRVRQMLADGLVPALRIGRAWAVEQQHVDRLKSQRSSSGRPWNPSSAWAALAAADGHDSSLSPVDRSRARRRLGQAGLVGVARRLAARAEAKRLYGHPSVLERVGEVPSVVRSGVSAASEYGADLVAGDFLEAYVPRSAVRRIVRRFALAEDAERANIVFRIVDDPVWPFAPDQRFAPRAVVAIDLLESSDERSRRAGLALARRSP